MISTTDHFSPRAALLLFILPIYCSTFTAKQSSKINIDIQPSHPIQTAINPSSKRAIQLTPYGAKTGRWQSLLDQGGWMVHKSQIVPIFGRRSKQSRTMNDLDSCYDDWFFLDPTFEILDDENMSSRSISALPRAEDLIWVCKPDGLLTLPGRTEVDSLAGRVNSFLFPDSSSRDKPWIPRPCHRLDRDTSGIIVIAKTKEAYTLLSKQFEDRLVTKQYVALVHGDVEMDSGNINASIGKKKTKEGFSVWTTDAGAEKMRDAVTDFHVSFRYLSKALDNTLDECYTRIILHPLTGRGHQLRLHMADILGHPIIGDTLHGTVNYDGKKKETKTAPRLCLHAEYLEFQVNVDNRSAVAKCWCLPPF